MKSTIDSITITIGERKLEFTMEEARTLKKLLESLEPPAVFPSCPYVIERIKIIERPRVSPPWRDHPWGDHPWTQPLPIYPILTCSSNGSPP